MKKLISLICAFTLMTALTVPSFAMSGIAKEAWYSESVSWALDNGIMDAPNGEFDTNTVVTRTDMISALYEYAKHIGIDVSDGKDTNILSFEDSFDIAEGKYEAFQWACAMELIAKDSETRLLPNEKLKREDMIKLLFDFAVIIGEDVSVWKDTNILSFNDAFDISEGYFEAFQWVCGASIVKGTSTTTLSPLANATRAQIATVIQRFNSGRNTLPSS